MIHANEQQSISGCMYGCTNGALEGIRDHPLTDLVSAGTTKIDKVNGTVPDICQVLQCDALTVDKMPYVLLQQHILALQG